MTTTRLRRLPVVLLLVAATACGSNAVQPESAPRLDGLAEREGKEVTVTAEVAGLIGDNAFTLVRREGGGGAEPLLVVHEQPTPITEELPVTVTGTVGIFHVQDLVELADPAALSQFEGRPFIEARDVRAVEGG